MGDIALTLQQEVADAVAEKRTLEIVGGGSKRFYGRTPKGEAFEVAGHTGIINYQPKELVLTARAGTLLTEIESVLADQGQMLAFEPPRIEGAGTLGGAVAAGLSGPARPYTGSVRDFVLGVTILNGRGELLRFGGEVMKNVAGYDLSRLMCGALGTLGVLLDISVKVMPINQAEETRQFRCSEEEALARLSELGRKALPVTATSYVEGSLSVRLAGSESAVLNAASQIGGESIDGKQFWVNLRDFQHDLFLSENTLVRVALPANVPPLKSKAIQIIDWNGMQRWFFGELDVAGLREQVNAAGGHLSLFRGGDRAQDVFSPLDSTLMMFHKRVKAALDPAGIFNPGRLYADF